MARQSKLLGSPFSSILVILSLMASTRVQTPEYTSASADVARVQHTAAWEEHQSNAGNWSKVETPGFSLEPQPASSDSVSPQTPRATSLERRDRLNGQPPVAAGRFKRITLPLSNRPGSISLHHVGHLLCVAASNSIRPARIAWGSRRFDLPLSPRSSMELREAHV